jgi:hypothetical protein
MEQAFIQPRSLREKGVTSVVDICSLKVKIPCFMKDGRNMREKSCENKIIVMRKPKKMTHFSYSTI